MTSIEHSHPTTFSTTNVHRRTNAHAIMIACANASMCNAHRCVSLHQARCIFTAKPIVHQLLHQLLHFLAPLSSEQNVHLGECLL
jgi:hypothetical protein